MWYTRKNIASGRRERQRKNLHLCGIFLLSSPLLLSAKRSREGVDFAQVPDKCGNCTFYMLDVLFC